MQKLIALKDFTNGANPVKKGQTFEATNQYARIYIALGNAAPSSATTNKAIKLDKEQNGKSSKGKYQRRDLTAEE